MMRYYKNTQDGYILGIGEYGIGTEITAAEYNEIMVAIQDAPTAPEGYAYKLRENLTWELVELPPEPDDPTVEDKAEAYDILMGVES